MVTVKDLINKCKVKGIGGYSGLRKLELEALCNAPEQKETASDRKSNKNKGHNKPVISERNSRQLKTTSLIPSSAFMSFIGFPSKCAIHAPWDEKLRYTLISHHRLDTETSVEFFSSKKKLKHKLERLCGYEITTETASHQTKKPCHLRWYIRALAFKVIKTGLTQFEKV